MVLLVIVVVIMLGVLLCAIIVGMLFVLVILVVMIFECMLFDFYDEFDLLILRLFSSWWLFILCISFVLVCCGLCV